MEILKINNYITKELTDDIIYNSIKYRIIPENNYFDNLPPLKEIGRVLLKANLKMGKLYLIVYLLKLYGLLKKKTPIKKSLKIYFLTVLRSMLYISVYILFLKIPITFIKDYNKTSNIVFLNTCLLLSASSVFIEDERRVKDLVVFMLPHFLRSGYKFIKYYIYNDKVIYLFQNYFYIISMGIFVYIYKYEKNRLSKMQNGVLSYLIGDL